jgi:2,4-dienoyl-CoA reductase-like NADH-dependent reductase (Old Yellow Enzyme family)/thioredoxin reductase
MEPKYQHLFSPIQVGDRVLKNRYIIGPHNTALHGGETAPTPSSIRFYANKAKGGAAVVQCGSCEVDRRVYQGRRVSAALAALNLYDPVNFHYFRQQTEAIHACGALAAMEVCYFQYGGISTANQESDRVYGVADGVAANGTIIHQMPVEEMERIAQEFAVLAENAVTVGMDMLCIHGAHGMQLAQFLSPKDNTRTDQFGGSLENRARFPMMILDAIRARVGRKILLDYRISGEDYVSGGWGVEECVAYTRLIQDRIDMIHVSAGNTMVNTPERIRKLQKPAYNAYLAKKFKQAGLTIPVAMVGNLGSDPDIDEQLLADGVCDLLVVARQSIADPAFAKKAQNGAPEDIAPCLHCYNCFSDHYRSYLFSCAVNPEIGMEHLLPDLTAPPDRVKRIAVIGGGPAGMEAAAVCARRGHQVTLYEQSGRLGGNIGFSSPDKPELSRFCTYLKTQLDKSGVQVRLNTQATPEMLAGQGVDTIIAALGADPVVPEISGLSPENYLPGTQVYDRLEEIGKTVVIVGGGLVGCEEALLLSERGHQVTLLEMTDALAADDPMRHRKSLLVLLEAAENLTIRTQTRCTGRTAQGVTCQREGVESAIPADTVIIAAGLRGRTQAAEQFRSCAPEFVAVGDCSRAGNVKNAMKTAYYAAIQI